MNLYRFRPYFYYLRAVRNSILKAIGFGFTEKRRRTLVHPGSRSPWRVWPAANFARVIDALQFRGHQIALLAGLKEQNIVDEILSHLSHPVPRFPKGLTIPQFAAVLASADLLLCHDSGPMHLAASVGTRVVALFGSQFANPWKPVGENNIIIQPPLPCCNCVTPESCVPTDSYQNHCVRNITSDQVLAAFDSQEKLRSIVP